MKTRILSLKVLYLCLLNRLNHTLRYKFNTVVYAGKILCGI